MKRGYGSTGVGNGKTDVASRVAWCLTNGPIPENFWILHHCDNPPCCNPAHLYAGTRDDNMRDMVVRRRHWAHRGLSFGGGERNSQAKLTEREVREIRARHLRGELVSDLAQAFSVSPSLIRQIARRAIWKEVA